MRLTPGTRLGPYEVLSILGTGGMAEVYCARDTRLGRDIALKVVNESLAGDPELVHRFEREARLAGSLNHPNLVAVYDFGLHEGAPYFITELLKGETLQQRLLRGPIPLDSALAWGAQLAHGLAAAHARGIVHRDVKPNNVFVTSDGHLKLLDFGIAKLAEGNRAEGPHGILDDTVTPTGGVTRSGAILGTPAYMSPEQVRGEKVDARTDIFSLGAVLYEMLSGRRPFPGDSLVESGHAILHDEPPPLAGVPPALAQLIRRCLEKDPEARFQSARDFAFALETGRSDVEAGPIPGESARRSLLRRPWWAVALLVVLATAALVARSRTALSPRIESLAVLPLGNLSGDPQQEYFADGMTEALITDLAKISALRVISRTSAMQYKGVKKPLPEIARELNVDAVVEGSIQRSGNRVLVTAQLIQASNDRHLWAESYERDLSDVLALESELARAIGKEIRVKLTPQEQRLFASARPVDPAAHDAYLKGMYYFNDGRDRVQTKGGAESFQKSVEYLQKAIRIDPSYALAYAQLARTYHWWASRTQRGPVAESREAARKALELDDSLAEAHGALAFVLYRFDRDWSGAEKEFKRAIELNPSYAEAHHGYALYLVDMGRVGEAITEINKALLLDPLTVPQRTNAAWIFACARQDDEAIEQSKAALRLNPDNPGAHYYLGEVYLRKAMYPEGMAEIQKSVELARDHRCPEVPLLFASAASGRRDEARRLFDQFFSRSKRDAVPASCIAEAYASLGDDTNAIAWLEKAAQEDPVSFGDLRCAEPLGKLRNDPRFQALLRRVGLPP